MDNFEHQLRVLIGYAQQQLGVNAFAIYKPGYLTIGYFDSNGELNVIADAATSNDQMQTFGKLYEQIHQRLRESVNIDIIIEY